MKPPAHIADIGVLKEILKEEERIYRILVESMNEGALVIAADGTVIYANYALEQMLGIPIEETTGMQIRDLVSDSDIETIERLIGDARVFTSKGEANLKTVRTDHFMPTYLSCSPLVIDDAESIVVVVTDRTEYKRQNEQLSKYKEHLEELVETRTLELKAEVAERIEAEEALRETQEDLNRAQTVAHTGSWRLNVHKNELLWSDETYRMFGIPKETPLNYEIFLGVIHPEDRNYVDRKWMAAMRGEPYDIEHRIIVNDDVKWVRERAELDFDQQGQLLGGFGTVQDITDSKQNELEKEELLKREHHISKMLQKTVIPLDVIPKINGYAIAAKYQPALKEAEVGGDFYDVFELGDGRYGILIGDVTGKGLEAAIRVVSARHTIRSYAFIDPRPAKVMILANNALCKDRSDEFGMLTAFYAVLDPSVGTITYTSAGHEPPIVCNAKGHCEEFELGGRPLGIMPDSDYYQTSRRIDAGDTILIVTDGITEARASGSVLYGKDRVVECLIRNRKSSGDQIASELLREATAFAGGQLQDDAAIVVIQPNSDKVE